MALAPALRLRFLYLFNVDKHTCLAGILGKLGDTQKEFSRVLSTEEEGQSPFFFPVKNNIEHWSGLPVPSPMHESEK